MRMLLCYCALTYNVLQLLYNFFSANKRDLCNLVCSLDCQVPHQVHNRFYKSLLNFVEKLYNDLKLLYYAWMSVRS